MLKETPKAALDPNDLAACQEVGDYLGAKGIDPIIFLSVVCSGAKVVVFRDSGPPPLIKDPNPGRDPQGH